MGSICGRRYALIAVVGGCASFAQALNIGWNDSAGGSFSAPANWLLDIVPGSADIATFSLGLSTGYTTTLNAPITNSQLFVAADNVTFDLHGQSYTLSDPGYSAGNFSMQIGSLLGGTASFTSSSAATVGTQYVGIAGLAGDSGTVNVSGPVTWTSSKSIRDGNGGSGTLNITGGASVSSLISTIGDLATSAGTATVDGAGSSWTSSDYLYVGCYGTGMLTVKNGARVNSTASYVGQYNIGSATITGTGSIWNAGYLDVAYDAAGTLNIENGATVNDSDAYVSSGSGAPGVVNVGANSTWTNTDTLYIGLVSGTTFNISGGSVSVTKTFGISNAPGTQVNFSSGTLRVGALDITGNPSLFLGNGVSTGWSGGTLDITTSNLAISSTGPLGSHLVLGVGKTLRVSGNGEALSIASDSSLNVAGGTVYANTLNNAGTLAMPKGSSVEAVNPLVNTGLIDISGGTLQLDAGMSGVSVRSQIRSAYDGGAWDGTSGITSTAAENDPESSTAVGYITTGSTTKLLYTWYGDADGNGVVNGADAGAISSTGTTWQTGDFNYDGAVNGDDWSLFLFGSLYGSKNISTLLPEPAALAMLLPMAGLVRRRRGKNV